MRKLHHVPPLASVVPLAFRARTCQEYCWRAARPPAEADVPVVDVHDEHEPLVSETHHSYVVAPELAAHVSVTGRDRFFWPFAGESLENAPGSVCTACVVNVHQVPASAGVSPAAFEARACQ